MYPNTVRAKFVSNLNLCFFRSTTYMYILHIHIRFSPDTLTPNYHYYYEDSKKLNYLSK